MDTSCVEVLSSIPQRLHAYNPNINFVSFEEGNFRSRYSDKPKYIEENCRRIVSEGEDMFADDSDDSESRHRFLRGLKEKLEEKGREILDKLVENDHVPIERSLRETLHEFKEKHGSDMLRKFHRRSKTGTDKDPTSLQRGVDLDDSTLKLERFKVKTVNVPGSGVIVEKPK